MSDVADNTDRRIGEMYIDGRLRGAGGWNSVAHQRLAMTPTTYRGQLLSRTASDPTTDIEALRSEATSAANELIAVITGLGRHPVRTVSVSLLGPPARHAAAKCNVGSDLPPIARVCPQYIRETHRPWNGPNMLSHRSSSTGQSHCATGISSDLQKQGASALNTCYAASEA